MPSRGVDAEATGRVSPSVAAALRSWLFVPGDSERKQDKALATAADALILDLEDSVAAAHLPAARERVARVLETRRRQGGPQLWVRVNGPASGLMKVDLAEVCAAGTLPDGVVLPKVSAADEIIDVAQYLETLERGFGRAPGSTRLLVIATETPRGLLALPTYPGALDPEPEVSARLTGLTWGAEDLGAALGATAKHDANGALTAAFLHARTACILAAAALGVQAIDGVCADFHDEQGLKRELTEARRDGFSGKLAIHPAQVAAINSAFEPTPEECARARRVIAAFAEAPGSGVASLDGQMIDRPHLLQAQRILALGTRAGRDT